jgi:ABC-2 type transport system permease protein
VTAASLSLQAALGVLKRDCLLFLSYRMAFITQTLSLFFTLTLFHFISRLVTIGAFSSPDAYYAFAVVGLITLQVLNSTLATPPLQLRQELVAGTFERMVVSPFGAAGSILSTMLFPFVSAFVSGLAMLAFAGLVFGLQIQWSTAPLAIPVALIGTCAFACFGVMLVGVVLVAKRASAGTTWVVAGISLIAGLYFPVALLPNWIEWASKVQPFTPSVELLRHVLIGLPMTESVWLSVVKIVGFTVVLFPLSTMLLNRMLRTSRRRGTIIEY